MARAISGGEAIIEAVVGHGVVTIVFNNGAYGNVRRDQIERLDGRVILTP